MKAEPTNDRRVATSDEDTTSTGVTPLLVIAWLVVGLPLLYAVVETARTAAGLF